MSPTIRIDDEVWAWLQSQGRVFEDTPNSVLRRIAGLHSKDAPAGSQPQRDAIRAQGQKTPQGAYREPLLRILTKHGGRASRTQVLKELEAAMKHQLTDFDKSDIKSGTIRWQ